MGDRANIAMGTPEKPEVHLYTHWSGTELPKTLQAALRRGKSRWDDSQYLARIIFQEMLSGDTGLTGYGISAECGDGSNRVLYVDCDTQRVRLPGGRPSEWSFADYCELDLGNSPWDQLRGNAEEED